MKRLIIPVSEEEHTSIHAKAGKIGLPVSEVSRRLLRAWLDKAIDLKHIEETCVRTVYIYGLVDPTDNQVYYIGQSTRPGNRLEGHIYEKTNTDKGKWLAGLLQDGVIPEVRILEETDSDNALCAENKWIKYGLDNGWPLQNMQPVKLIEENTTGFPKALFGLKE